MSNFGEAIARYRVAIGMSQRELGAAIGLDPTQVNKVERGHRPPLGAKYMVPLARALHLTEDEAENLVKLAGHSIKVLEFKDEVAAGQAKERTQRTVSSPPQQTSSSRTVAHPPQLRRPRGGALASDPIDETKPYSRAVEATTIGQEIDEILKGLSQKECDIIREILVSQARQLDWLVRLNRGG